MGVWNWVVDYNTLFHLTSVDPTTVANGLILLLELVDSVYHDWSE